MSALLASVNFGWRLITKRLVRALVVVELQIPCEPVTGLARAGIVVQVDLLIFDRTPQPLGEDVIQRPPAPVHADLDIGGEQHGSILGAREMAALVTVPDLWPRLC